MTTPDLFALASGPMLTPEQKKKLTRREPKRGHAWTPGTGPEGETCGTCKHLTRRYLAKTYLKCGMNRAAWTGGPGSDIRAKDAACKLWSKAG